MEDILTHLSRIDDFRVTSRTSAMTYKGVGQAHTEDLRPVESGHSGLPYRCAPDIVPPAT